MNVAVGKLKPLGPALAAALALATGPAVFAHQAECQRRAAEELAKSKARQAPSSDSDSATDGKPEHGSHQTSAPAKEHSEAGGASFVAAGVAKPSETQGAAPIAAALGAGVHGQPPDPLPAAGDCPGDTLRTFRHHPPYQAQAPPRS